MKLLYKENKDSAYHTPTLPAKILLFLKKEENSGGDCSLQHPADYIDDVTVRGCSPILILLLYNVFTTGSTLFACFQALRTVFPPSVRISVATLGFVGVA